MLRPNAELLELTSKLEPMAIIERNAHDLINDVSVE
jgi:hypothetical protein